MKYQEIKVFVKEPGKAPALQEIVGGLVSELIEMRLDEREADNER